MTWVVGFSAFNGVLCAADVQVTFPYKNANLKPLYFDCLKKIHRLWKNAYIAFSGDVRVGLQIIATLQELLEEWLEPQELFTLEGQRDNFQKALKDLYQIYAGPELPFVQFMVAYMHQEELQFEFRPAICRFTCPDFIFNSSGYLQLDQCGSGKLSEELQVIAEFLKGRRSTNLELYNKIFPDIETPPTVTTVRKARSLLIREAALSAQPGVSSTYCSVIAETKWNNIFTHSDRSSALEIMRELGAIYPYSAHTRADQIEGYTLDIAAYANRFENLWSEQPDKLLKLIDEFKRAVDKGDASVLTEYPEFEECYHAVESSPLENTLCTNWEEMKMFMGSKDIPITACAAIA